MWQRYFKKSPGLYQEYPNWSSSRGNIQYGFSKFIRTYHGIIFFLNISVASHSLTFHTFAFGFVYFFINMTSKQSSPTSLFSKINIHWPTVHVERIQSFYDLTPLYEWLVIYDELTLSMFSHLSGLAAAALFLPNMFLRHPNLVLLFLTTKFCWNLKSATYKSIAHVSYKPLWVH